MIKVEKLLWDKWNIEHIKKHGVSKNQVKKAVYYAVTARDSSKKERKEIDEIKN